MPYCSFLRSSSNPALIPSRFGSGSSQASQNSGDICRICHCESDPQNPLLTPCYCSGSLKYVHQACLQQWLTASETNSCELCKFPFIMHTKIKPFNEVGSSHMWHFLIECQLIYFTLSLHCLASESIGLDWIGLDLVGLAIAVAQPWHLRHWKAAAVLLRAVPLRRSPVRHLVPVCAHRAGRRRCPAWPNRYT